MCQVCAGVGGTDTCNGDSGGPLLADKLGDRSDNTIDKYNNDMT